MEATKASCCNRQPEGAGTKNSWSLVVKSIPLLSQVKCQMRAPQPRSRGIQAGNGSWWLAFPGQWCRIRWIKTLRNPSMMAAPLMTRKRSRCRLISTYALPSADMSSSVRPSSSLATKCWRMRMVIGIFTGVMWAVLLRNSLPSFSLISASTITQGCISWPARITSQGIWCAWPKFSLVSTTFSRRLGSCLRRWTTSASNLIRRRTIRPL